MKTKTLPTLKLIINIKNKRMLISIISHRNRSGLEKDRIIITEILQSHGFQVCHIDPFKTFTPLSKDSEISIFLEYYDERYLGRKNILIPNQEWFFSRWLPELDKFDAVFCKTFFAQQIFNAYHNNVIFTGFTSLDYYDGTIEKQLICFHSNGKSRAKGTEFIIKAWEVENLPELHLVSNIYKITGRPQSPLFHYSFLKDRLYRNLMNKCLIHVYPSQVKGFGHCLNESKSCGSVVITTDYPPMNEHCKQFSISPKSIYRIPDRLGAIVYINPVDIANMIDKITQRDDLFQLGRSNRISYLKNDKRFRALFSYNIKKL